MCAYNKQKGQINISALLFEAEKILYIEIILI